MNRIAEKEQGDVRLFLFQKSFLYAHLADFWLLLGVPQGHRDGERVMPVTFRWEGLHNKYLF
jgi:hypothetical protein